MLDNQTRMRSMLDLIEAVDQGKKIKLNESADQTADQTWTVEYTIETKSYGADTENETFGEKTVKAKSAAEAIEKVKSSTKRAYDFKAHPVKNVNEAVEDSDSSSDAEELANDALDAAALSIQDALGIEDGDFAGMFFAGDAGKTILEILTDYAREEIRNQSEDSDSEIDEGMIGDVYNTLRAKNYDRLAARSDSKSVSDGEMSPGPNWAIHQPIAKQRTQKAADIRRAVSDKKEFEKSGGSTDQIKDLISANNIGANYKESKDLKLKESGEGNSSSREKAIDGGAYEKWDPKHPNFVKNYKKFKASNPEGTLKDFIAKLKKGLAEGVRLKKFRQVADILKTLPENNRKILAKRHCKIFENHNPRFNSKKFMTYIGLNEGDVEDFLARGGKIQQGAPTDKKTPRARNSSYTDHSMRKGEQGRRGRGYQDYDPDDHQSRNDDIDYARPDIRKPEYESKQMNELDPGTLGSYAKKASADATNRQSKITGHNEFQNGARTMAGAVYGDKVQRFPDRTDPKIAKRQAGVGKAIDRLTQK